MKHYLFFILAICVLVVDTASAQLGLKIGSNLSGFSASTSNGYRTSTDDKLTYQVGVFYKKPLTKRLYIVPELQYANEEMVIRQTSDYDASFSAIYAANFLYLNAPFLLRANLNIFYFEVGPQAGILLGGHETGTININQTTLHINRSVIDYITGYRHFDVGPALGIGITLPSGVGLNLRAYQGLVSLTHDAKANIAHLYRQSFQASLIYQFNRKYQRT